MRERQRLTIEELAHHACVNVDRLRAYERLVDASGDVADILLSESELERVIDTLGVTIPRLLQQALVRSPENAVYTSANVRALERSAESRTPEDVTGASSAALQIQERALNAPHLIEGGKS